MLVTRTSDLQLLQRAAFITERLRSVLVWHQRAVGHMADVYDGEFVSSLYCRSPDLVTSNHFASIETPEGWEPCTDGGFIRYSRGAQGSEEPVTGPFGLLQARLFNHKLGYSSPSTGPCVGFGADGIEPFRLPPPLVGEVSASSSSEILPTGEENRSEVEVPAEFEDSSLEGFVAPPEACHDGGGCLGRRRATSEPLSLPADLVETDSVSHKVPQAPMATIALAPGGPAPAAAAAAAAPPKPRSEHMALHCVSEVAYKPPWSPRGHCHGPVQATVGPWQWLIVEVHALLGCSVDNDVSLTLRGREGGPLKGTLGPVGGR